MKIATFMDRSFTYLYQGLIQLFFPAHCLLCSSHLNESLKTLCSGCLSQLPYNLPPFCKSCGIHMDIFTPQGQCLSCLRQPKAVDRAWACFKYDQSLEMLIHAYKYHSQTRLRHLLGTSLIRFIRTYRVPVDHFDMVCPIALHPARLRERGYNQSELLSRLISQTFRLPHYPGVLKRHKPTMSQAQCNAKQRWTNMQGAFTINPIVPVADKSILLVDDLWTTGSTMHHAAAALKENGAAYVGAITLAIAT